MEVFLFSRHNFKNMKKEKEKMVTLQTIKRELENIRYYYARKDIFDKAFDSVGKNEILQTVDRYNQAICGAPPKLYEMYVALYIQCCTYEAAAEALCDEAERRLSKMAGKKLCQRFSPGYSGLSIDCQGDFLRLLYDWTTPGTGKAGLQ